MNFTADVYQFDVITFNNPLAYFFVICQTYLNLRKHKYSSQQEQSQTVTCVFCEECQLLANQMKQLCFIQRIRGNQCLPEQSLFQENPFKLPSNQKEIQQIIIYMNRRKFDYKSDKLKKIDQLNMSIQCQQYQFKKKYIQNNTDS
ncbi:hypothetical protein pb186bvf_016367 [Paramecium bursaria]